MSANIQNNIIDITMEYSRNQIISEIPDHAPFFAILADETTDTSNTEQLCISIRFVYDTYSIHEEFLGFVRCKAQGVSSHYQGHMPSHTLDHPN